ncbi:hypothetical protein [Xenorhabdus szentirmaii]|nr:MULTISPECIES: hypothetical protein [unclassified Xenorhabdus]
MNTIPLRLLQLYCGGREFLHRIGGWVIAYAQRYTIQRVGSCFESRTT